jgi:hypothetical protein
MQTGTEQMDQRATGHIIPSLKPIRRVVTGHDAEGNAIILENDDAKQILANCLGLLVEWGWRCFRVATGTPTSLKNSSCPAGEHKHSSLAV